MFVQRNIAWSMLGLLLALAVYGLAGINIPALQIWTSSGLLEMVLFCAGFASLSALLIMLAPGRMPLMLLALVAAYSAVSAGPLAVLGVAYMLWSSYAVGAIWLRNRPRACAELPHAVILLGLATWITLFSLTARWRIHYWAVYLAAMAVPILWAWLRKAAIPRLPLAPLERNEHIDGAIVALPLLAQWLMALKPEVGRDALAIHMVVPARIAAQHYWAFDVKEFLWAVKPMGAEWAFSIAWLFGGEGGARLLNWALLAITCWLLFDWLRSLVPGRLAALLTAGFAATPLTLHVTGSLRPENLLAGLLLAAFAFLRRYNRSSKPLYWYTSAFLAGAAATCTPAAFAYITPLVIAACFFVPVRVLAPGLAFGLIIGATPYVEASMRTASPVFPYLNSYFGSQLFDTTRDFLGDRLNDPIRPSFWYDFVFDDGRVEGGRSGSFGFLFFLLVPLCFASFKRNWPRIGWALIATAIFGIAIGLTVDTSLRRFYPALPMLTVAIGIMGATFRPHSRALEIAITAVAGLALVLNLAFFPAASQAHSDFALNQVFGSRSVEQYIARHAPERKLIETLNQRAPSSRAAWLESNVVAEFQGRAFSNSWHSEAFKRQLEQAPSVQAEYFLFSDLKIEYFVAPLPESPWPARNIYSREFLETYTKQVSVFGGMELRQIQPVVGLNLPQLPFAPPGTHDDLNSFVHYEGPWTRDLDVPRAYRGTLAYSNDLRARLVIRFQGSVVTPLHTAAANRCEAVLSLDDAPEVPFIQQSDTTRWQARGPRLMTEPGEHRLEIHMPKAGSTADTLAGCYLDFDGFIVE